MSTNILTLNGVGGMGIDATAQTSGTTTISAALSLGANQTWAVGSGGTLEVNGVISGTQNLNIGSGTATGTVILTAVNTLSGTVTISNGTTLQLGGGATAGDGSLAGPITLAGANSKLNFNNANSLIYSGVLTGPAGSSINVNGAGPVILNGSSTFAGTVNVAGGAALQLGDGTNAGALGATSSIALLSGSPVSTATFNQPSNTTYSGTISGPAGSVLNISGPSAGVTTTLTNLNPSFAGTVNVLGGTNTLQLGDGINAANDGNFGAASVNVLANNLVINNVGARTLSYSLTSNSAFISFNGTGATTVTGKTTEIITTGNTGNSYLIFNGGPVTFTGSIDSSSNASSEYFYDRTNSAIILSNASNPFAYAPKFYMQAINGSSSFTGENITLAAGATLSGTSNAIISNENNNAAAPFTANTLPPPVVFNDNGTITTPTLYVNYNSGSSTVAIGQTTLNINGTSTQAASVVGNIYSGFNTSTGNCATSTINIGNYGSLVSTSSTKDQFSISAGNYAYITLAGTNATINAVPASGTGIFYVGAGGSGAGGDAFMEIGNGGTLTAGPGAATSNYTTGGNPGFILGDTTGGTDFAVVNVYHGGTLNNTSTHSGDTNFGMGMAAGVTAVLSAIGGTINNKTVNSPITLGYVVGATSLLNIDSDGSGNKGLVITSYLKAVAAQTAAYVNFNGGELEFANNNNAAQGNFITTAIQGGGTGGVYIYSNGAIIGTNASGNTAVNVTIPSVLRAPTLDGITSITVNGGGTGYTAPPLVKISGGGGSGASAYATINASGTVTNVIITSPGIGYTSAPTISFVDGGTPLNGNGAAYTFTAASATASIAPNATTGGLTKVDTGTLILSAANTYGGPTLITAGTLEFTGASNATNAIVAQNTASATTATTLYVSNTTTNNNVASAATILVGDQPSTGALPNVGSFTINNTLAGGFILNSTAVSSTAGQTLAGFGKITGSSAVGLTVANQTVIAPGTGSGTAVQSLTATPYLTSTTSGTPTATFNTANQGNATGTATGALTLTGASGMTTTFGPGGTYYWKLNQYTGGSGSTLNGGTVNASDVSGTNWDALVMDVLNVTSTPTNAFTIQGVAFTPTSGSPTNPVNIGGANTTNYSWTIARVGTGTGTPPNLANFLANFALNTAGLPTPAAGYGYYLTAQTDTANTSDTDLVVNYAPTPEPCSLVLFVPAAGILLRRRRSRRSALAVSRRAR